jgi:hypothetical protein
MMRFDVPEFGDIAGLSAEAYAARVRVAYDRLVRDCSETDPLEAARHVLLQFVAMQCHAGMISAEHQTLAAKLLPQPKQSRGRPAGAQGDAAYERNWQLCYDWVYDKTLNPALTEEQFAKNRLHILEKDYDRDPYGRDHKRVSNLLKDLQPSRLKQRLGENVIRAIYIQAKLTARNAAEHRSSGASQS